MPHHELGSFLLATLEKIGAGLHQPEVEEMFSSATRAQINLGKAVSDQIKGKPISELRSILDLCLKRNEQWGQASRNAVVNAPAAGSADLDENQVLPCEAFGVTAWI